LQKDSASEHGHPYFERQPLRILQFPGEIPTATSLSILQSANRQFVCLCFALETCRPFAGDFRRRQDMGINKDQVEGRVKEAAGKVQEVAGKTVGSTTQQVKGAANKAAGAAQAKYGDVKNDLNKNSKPDR
jgi:uncharacterized protein YjbJ (UPF0337 family)